MKQASPYSDLTVPTSEWEMAESEQRSATSGHPGSVGLLEQPLGAQLSSQESLTFFRVLGDSQSRQQRLGLILPAEGHVQAGLE